MKLRTQLILAFVLLAVVPLAGITLFSYHSSLHAFRQAVEAEAAQLAEDMGRRMESVRSDLDRRIQSLQTESFVRLVSTAPDQGKPGMEDLYTELVAKLGDAAGMLETIEFKGMPPPHSPVDAPHPPVPPPPVSPPDSFVIVMPGAAQYPPPASGVVGPLGELAIDAPGGDKLILKSWEMPAESTRNGPPEPKAAAKHKRREFHLQWIAGKLEEKAEMANLQAARIREKVESVRSTNIEEAARVRRSAEAEAVENRLECLDFTSNLPTTWESEGQVFAQVNAKEILWSVLSRTRTREGEIAFAVDQFQQIYTAKPEHRDVLSRIGLAESAQRPLGNLPEDWLVVEKTDQTTGVTFGIARPIGEGLVEIRNAAVRNLGYGLGMVAVALFGILPLSGRMTRNLSVLTDNVRRVAAGNLDSRAPIRSRDEFGELSRAFNEMAAELKRNQAHLVEQERLKKELEMCRRIQQEMLPRNPLLLPLAEVHGVSIPAREVGGDFFNYFPLRDGRTALLIGDVAGKGVAAALLMANLQATLRARLPVANDLISLARELDREIDASTPSEAYVTLFLALMDKQARTIRWLNAGHNTQYLLRADGNLEPMGSSGRPLGLLPGGDFTESITDLKQGDTLFLYTDGLVEAEDASGMEFGTERLESILLEERLSDSQKLLSRVEQAVREFRGEGETNDDATMLVLKTHLT